MEKNPCVMVCITRQRSCERLIHEGARLAGMKKCSLLIVHVVHPEANFLGTPHEGEALDYLFSIAKMNSAEISLLKSDDVADCLIRYAQDNNVVSIVMGQAKDESMKENGGIIWRLHAGLPETEVQVISAS